MAQNIPAQSFGRPGMISIVGLQLGQPGIHKVITYVSFRLYLWGRRVFCRVVGSRRLGSEFHCRPRDLKFIRPRPFTDSFDYMTVAIAGCKFHLRVSTRGILSQQRLDKAYAFEKIAPVEGRKKAHAGDYVANGHLRCRLTLMLRPVRRKGTLVHPEYYARCKDIQRALRSCLMCNAE